MSNLTSELNLSLAVDDDDTADYLTIALSDSLTTLDGMFNATTGHNHNGSHQGGALEFLDLVVGEDLLVQGATELVGAAHLRSNLTVDGAATVATTLNVGGLATVNSLDVTTTSRFRGQVTMDAGINAAGGLTITGSVTATGDITGRYLYTSDGSNGIVHAGAGNLYLRAQPGQTVIIDQGGVSVAGGAQFSSWLAAGGNLSGTGGDITANRGNGQGYVFLGNASRYIGFDGSNYVLPSAQLYVQGQQVATSDNGMTLNNKYLGDPFLTGQVAISGPSYTLPTVSGNAGKWRYIKAWGQNMVINLTNGTLILFGVQYGSGQYTLRNGDSLSCYCDGGNWWVL